MRRSLGISAVVVITGMSLGTASAVGARAARPLSHTAAQVFSTAASGGTQYTVTKQGNVTSFLSPNSAGNQYDHLSSAGNPGAEGYVVCYETPAQDLYAWDTVTTFWGFQKPEPYTVISPTEGSVRRTDIYNRETFTQDFQFDPTTGALTITMKLKNISSAPLTGIVIRRTADLNVDSGGAQGWDSSHINHFSSTSSSVTAWNDASEAPAGLAAHTVVLRDISHDPSVSLTPQILGTGDAHGCDPRVAAHPKRPGDHGVSLSYGIASLAAGASQTVVVQYQRTA